MTFQSDSIEYQAVRDDWHKRSEMWLKKSRQMEPYRRKRQRRTHPLILTGHGMALRVDRGTLFIKDGFSHYPQKGVEHRFFPGDPAIPTRILIIDGTGSISLAVLDWLREQGVTLVRVDWQGNATTVIAGRGAGPDVEKLKWQIDQASDPEKRVAFARTIIEQKLLGSLVVLREIIPETRACTWAIQKLESTINELRSSNALTVDKLLSLEGNAAKRYFHAWNGLELKWIKQKQYPIPPRWRAYKYRPSLAMRGYGVNRNATHPINAMLNYGYAILESEMRIKLVSHGYDPRIGIFHQRIDGSRDSLVFDIMELERARVDRAVLEFAMRERFCAKDFVLTKDGVCRLSPILTKSIAVELTLQ